MPDRDLTDEEYDFINTALDVIAQSDPGGPTAEEDRMYCSLLDMGCTEQWIAEQLREELRAEVTRLECEGTDG